MEPESKNSTGDDELQETYSESLLMRSWSESTSSSFVLTADCLHNKHKREIGDKLDAGRKLGMV